VVIGFLLPLMTVTFLIKAQIKGKRDEENWIWGSLALIKREFHYFFCRRRIAPEIK
jgi:hypothetical protein